MGRRAAEVLSGRPRTSLCSPDVTPGEAELFLAAVGSWLEIDDDRKKRSDRFPPLQNGSPRGYNFFESRGDKTGRGRIRLESIPHIAAAQRLHAEFGWPLEHTVLESPKVVDSSGEEELNQDALDILLLEESCDPLEWPMPAAPLRSRVIVEAKFKARGASGLEGMIRKMRGCRGVDHAEHAKCQGLQVFRPDWFLGVAASETWRLFKVIEGDNGRLVLGDEIPPDEQGPHLQFKR